MFSIEAEFTTAELEKIIADDMQKWFDELSSAMMKTGMSITDQAIEKARALAPFDGGGFGNITFNLRSSIGCGLFYQGEIKQDYFPFGKGDEGQENGRKLMNEVAATIPDDEIGLIFVAGENYATFVQAKGYDVTDMSFEKFEREFFSKLK